MKNSSKGTYYRNIDYEMGEVDTESADLCLAELVKGKPYVCKTWAEPQASKKNDKKSAIIISFILSRFMATSTRVK